MAIRTKLKHLTSDIFLITIGVLLAGLGLESFLIPNKFIDGGITGVSMLAALLTKDIPLAIFLVVLNIPFVLLGTRSIGMSFGIRSAIGIAGLSLAIVFVPYPVLTEDKLLCAIFGGAFIGAGIGFAMRGGGVLDGTEALAILLSRRIGLTVGDLIIMINLVIFTAAAFVMSLPDTMYSILTYFMAARTIDFVIHGWNEYTAVTIISPRHEAIKKNILHELGAGVTIYKGEAGYSGAPQDILFCVVTKLEIYKIKNIAYTEDENAFILSYKIDDAVGGVLKRKKLH